MGGFDTDQAVESRYNARRLQQIIASSLVIVAVFIVIVASSKVTIASTINHRFA
jgi:t-SNARE complex subunit (syntaxin)